MGIKHQSRYHEGDRVNDRFTLIRNYCRPTTIKGKNEWLWECRCDCGNTFNAREHTLVNRFGCRSCTNKKSSTDTALRKNEGIIHVGLKNRLLKDYRTGASRRNLDFELTFDEFVSLAEGDCVYCGAKPTLHEYELQYMQKTQYPWKHNGIDRIDSSKGYTLDNCVPCCSKCNYAKHEMSVDEFKKWIVRVYNNLISSSTTISEESTSQANGDGNSKSPTNFMEFPQFRVTRS